MIKKAPDADENKDRTIGFSYCIHMGGHVAHLDEYIGPGETKRTRICFLRDGEDVRYEKEIELLKSWGEIMVSYPVRDSLWHGLGFGTQEYRLQDTPKVRELLRKIDGEHCSRLSAKLQALIKEANEAGYVIAKWSPSQDHEWLDLPTDLRARIYKK